MKITVLGAGLVGSAIIKDLAKEKEFRVTAIDASRKALMSVETQALVRGISADLGDADRIPGLIAEADLVICAVPGFMGFKTLEKVIEAGKNVVDISFFPEDPFLLDELARAKGVTAVVNCGVAPGLSNIILGHADTQLDRSDRFLCYVGGLPQVRQWPYEYKAVFSPVDVLEEYTRPARFVEHGQELIRPALSEVELLDLPGVGTVEAFNSDGLRSLIRTMDIPSMKEKTLRYPGHANLMRVFRESGFFDAAPVMVDGQKVSPLALTSKLLFDQWKMQAGEHDLTVMRVIIEGRKAENGVYHTLRHTYDLLDRFDPVSQTTSMARTTGYTCTAVARQVLAGRFTQIGICPPEFVGRTPGCYENLLDEYAARGIHITETTETVET